MANSWKSTEPLIVAVLAVALSACGAKDLTRSNAASLIAANSQFTPVAFGTFVSGAFGACQRV